MLVLAGPEAVWDSHGAVELELVLVFEEASRVVDRLLRAAAAADEDRLACDLEE